MHNAMTVCFRIPIRSIRWSTKLAIVEKYIRLHGVSKYGALLRVNWWKVQPGGLVLR